MKFHTQPLQGMGNLLPVGRLVSYRNLYCDQTVLFMVIQNSRHQGSVLICVLVHVNALKGKADGCHKYKGPDVMAL